MSISSQIQSEHSLYTTPLYQFASPARDDDIPPSEAIRLPLGPNAAKVWRDAFPRHLFLIRDPAILGGRRVLESLVEHWHRWLSESTEAAAHGDLAVKFADEFAQRLQDFMPDILLMVSVDERRRPYLEGYAVYYDPPPRMRSKLVVHECTEIAPWNRRLSTARVRFVGFLFAERVIRAAFRPDGYREVEAQQRGRASRLGLLSIGFEPLKGDFFRLSEARARIFLERQSAVFKRFGATPLHDLTALTNEEAVSVMQDVIEGDGLDVGRLDLSAADAADLRRDSMTETLDCSAS